MLIWRVVQVPVEPSTSERLIARLFGLQLDPYRYFAVLYRVPLWAATVTKVTDCADGLLGHVLCGSGKGPFKYLQSHCLNRAFELGLFCEDRHEEELYRCELPREVALAASSVSDN
jgi:hypothetical protein